MATYDLPPESRRVDSGQATAWLSEGWKLFMAAPAVWMVIGVVFIVIQLVLNFVPVLGSVAHMLLLPVLAAGLMDASRRVAIGEPLAFETLFAGFRNRTGNLVMVGLLTLGAVFAISVVAFGIVLIGGGSGVFTALKNISDSGVDMTTASTAASTTAGLGLALGSLLVAALVWLVLILPLTMAVWFAPALVFFDGMTPVAAMKSSFAASLRNWLSLTIYGILIFVLMSIATITVVGLLVIVPVIATSLYLSYRDIYH